MRRLAVTVALFVGIGMSVGCATARRPRGQPRAAAAKPAKKPKQVKPIWFGPQGETDGRMRSDGAPGDAEGTAMAAKRGVFGPNAESPLGTNLAPVRTDSRDWVFVDVFKMAAPWELRAPNSKTRKFDLGNEGWPAALASGHALVTRVPTFGGGQFVVLYEGRGDLKFGNAALLEEAPGRIVLEAQARQQIEIRIETTNPQNPVRNIRVVPAAFEATYEDQIFHPLFVQRLSRFSVLRFAGWTRTDDTAAPTWERRVKTDWYTQAGPAGVAYEYMFDLANKVGADVWISIPHRANNDLVEQIAKMAKARLRPELAVYVEYGNELHRVGTPGARYVTQQGQFLGLDPEPRIAALKYQVQRSMAVYETFEAAFGARRLVRVLSGALERPADLKAALEYQDAAKRIDMLAVAPFVGVRIVDADRGQTLAGMTASEILDALEFTMLPSLMSRIRAAQRVASEYGVALGSYSGGQDLFVKESLRNADVLDKRFDEVSRDPRVGSIYLALLSGWAKSGGELFVHGPLVDAYGSRGRTAALEYQDQSEAEAPRFAALMSFMKNNQRWWGKRQPKPRLPDVVANAGGPAVADLTKTPDLGSQRPAIWGAGGAGVASVAAAAVFTGLYLRSTSLRNRFVAENPFAADGSQARSWDNQGYNWSVAMTTSLGLAAAGLGTAGVLAWLDESESEKGDLNQGLVLSASTGAVALSASTAFFIAYLNTLSERDTRLDTQPNPTSSNEFRNLDDEAFRWSVASGAALGVAVASFAASLVFYVADAKDPYVNEYLEDYYEQEPSSGVDVTVAPTGVMVRW